MSLELQGKQARALVYGNAPDDLELAQIRRMLDCPAFEGAEVRIMPDHHAGAGCVIGFTARYDPARPRIVPNVIGVDIGCGVASVEIERNEIDFALFDLYLCENVPSGFSIREKPLSSLRAAWARRRDDREVDAFGDVVEAVERAAATAGVDASKVWRSAGTLGGGNHFVEIGRPTIGTGHALTVHTGSRNFGLRVATHYQKIAKALRGDEWGDLAWLEGDDARAYLRDMKAAQAFAALNRAAILDVLLGFFGERLGNAPEVESVHNFIGDDGVIRKGAISAEVGELVVIPWNMRDGILVGSGRGCDAWNRSAPHGAGRALSRKQAKSTLTVEGFKAEMAGIWSSSINAGTLDEAPAAYKPFEEVREAIGETVDALFTLRPVYNFKAGDEPPQGVTR